MRSVTGSRFPRFPRFLVAATLSAFVAATLLPGCEPITVSVAPDGRIAFSREEGVFVVDLAKGTIQAIARPTKDQGAASVVSWSPDGSKLAYLLVKGDFDLQYSLMVHDLAGNKAEKIYQAKKPILHMHWSPDGKWVSVGEAAPTDEEIGGHLKLVSLDGKTVKTLAKQASLAHRWTADGKWILAYTVDSKVGDRDVYKGSISLIEVETGKPTKVASTVCGKEVYCDVTADGKEAVFLAMSAGPADAEAPAPGEGDEQWAFRWDGKAVTKLWDDATLFCRFSPDGKKVLGMAGSPVNLTIRDLASGKDTTLDQNVAAKASQELVSVPVYPVFLTNGRIFYWKNKTTYGRTGSALTAFTVDAEGKSIENAQVTIDKLVHDATK